MMLADLQRDFCNMLVDAPSNLDRWLSDEGQKGLAVYHNAYRTQLQECLSETFEHLRAWLGDEVFERAAHIHSERSPPHSWTLGHYGEGFDRTLAELYPDDPEVAELAWLEWSLSRAFEGPDAPGFDPARLTAIDWDEATLTLVPTLRSNPVRTNAGAIWSALSAGENPPVAAMLPEPAIMLIWRQEFTPCFRTIETVEADALDYIASGATFGMLCATLVKALPDEEGVAKAGALLGQWISDGLVTAIH